jgi:NAD(P)-dependent dehydrogenase (short-subunit alcohol dehydrogenase family)
MSGEKRPNHGPRCLVFGGSGVLGGAVCRILVRRGARVAFTYNTGVEKARSLEEELDGAVAIPLDLDSVDGIGEAVARAAETLGGIDAFVHCAGVAITMECSGPNSHHRMPEIDEAGYDRMMDVNVKSAFFAIRSLIGVMGEGGGGNVVLIGSIDGVKPVPSPVHYAASKGALAGMTQAMAKELGSDGIRVNMVAPGIMDGGISRDIPPELLDEYVKHCGMKRVGDPEEVAGVAVWFALENTYVTGQTVLVDGGL